MVRKTIRVSVRKPNALRENYSVTIPEDLMAKLLKLGWKLGKTELIPSIQAEGDSTILVYRPKK